MKRFACLCACVLSFLACGAPPAFALANRVFVSAKSGNNANSCDNVTTPCQTFAGAVLQLNPDGEVIVLDSGGYGPVTITQGLTIEAPPGVLAFVHPPSGDAITVNASGATVVLRGLVLNGGTANGITVSAADTVHIENCVVSGFTIGVGISAPSVNTSLFVKDTIVRGNFSGLVDSGARTTVDRCRFEANSYGVIVDGGNGTVRDSVSAGNSGIGFSVQSTTTRNAVLNVERCVAANNVGDGIYAHRGGSGTVVARVSNSSITENGAYGLDNSGVSATFESLGNNFVRGNTGGPTNGTITIVGGN